MKTILDPFKRQTQSKIDVKDWGWDCSFRGISLKDLMEESGQ